MAFGHDYHLAQHHVDDLSEGGHEEYTRLKDEGSSSVSA